MTKRVMGPTECMEIQRDSNTGIGNSSEKCGSLDEALNEIAGNFRIPMHRWLEASKTYSEF